MNLIGSDNIIFLCVSCVISNSTVSDEKEKTFDRVDTLYNQYLHLYEQGHYQESIKYATQLVQASEKAYGKDHNKTAIFLSNLAVLYRTVGDYTKAESLYKQALAICEKALGPEHPSAAAILNNLAELYKIIGKKNEAKKLENKAKRILSKRILKDL